MNRGERWHVETQKESFWKSLAVFGTAMALIFAVVVLASSETVYGTEVDLKEDANMILVSSDIVQMDKNEVKSDKILTEMKQLLKKGTKASKKSSKASSKGKLTVAKRYLSKVKKHYSKLRVKLDKIRKLNVKGKYIKARKMVRKMKRSMQTCMKDYSSSKKRVFAKKKHEANARKLRRDGIRYDGKWKYTWYSQNVLPGYGLHIPGRHVGLAGMVMDKNGYVCVASSSLRKGATLNTPFGKAKVYDTGCPYGVIDIYVSW